MEWIELLGRVIEGVGRGLLCGLLVASLKMLLTLACKPMDPVVPQSIPLPQLLCRKENCLLLLFPLPVWAVGSAGGPGRW